jgi:hypothetical protein
MTTFKLWYGMISLGTLTLIMGTTLIGQGQFIQGAVATTETPTPTRPGPPTFPPTDIPPTGTVAPTPPSPEKAASQPEGAFIVLQIACTEPSARAYWTAVQWQDRLGAWHTVEGWQGTFDKCAHGRCIKEWWLPPSLFGQGPFRWVVYAKRGGEILTRSDPFSLPIHHLRRQLMTAP